MNQDRIPILILGASGHGCVAADAVCAGSAFRVAGFADGRSEHRESSGFGPVLGTDTDIPAILSRHSIEHLFVAIGDNWTRQQVVARIRSASPSLHFPALVHPSAVIGSGAEMGDGSLICSGAVIGVGARAGAFSIVNTRASLDHHASLGDFASLAPAAATGGNAIIEEGTAIGMGAMVHHGVKIGAWSVLGSGSVANRDVPASSVALGSPARVVRSREPNERYL
jgi:sugar O-acyltransferase (sialic acid O-acetyltransferase NeuD family)